MTTAIRRGGNGCIGIWCIADRTTGEKYGDAYLLPLPRETEDVDWNLVVPDALPEGDIEVGFFLKPSAWGNGFATEVCQRLIRFAFEETTLQEIVATVDERNHGSINVLEKNGFNRDGEAVAYGKRNPFFRLGREQWMG